MEKELIHLLRAMQEGRGKDGEERFWRVNMIWGRQALELAHPGLRELGWFIHGLQPMSPVRQQLIGTDSLWLCGGQRYSPCRST